MAFSKQLLILTPGFPHTEADTANVPYLQDYILALKEKISTDNIKIISIHYPYTSKKYLWHGIEVFPVNGRNKKGIRKLFLLLKTFRIAKKLVQKRLSVIHTFWLSDSAFVGNMLQKKLACSHIITCMGQDVKPDNKLFRFLDFEKSIVITLSENQDEVLFESTGRHANYILPLPLPEIEEINPSDERDIDVLFVGSFITLKHPEIFISIIKRLKTKFQKLKAVMVGDGILLDEMKNEIALQQLSDTIQIAGKLERKDVFNYMKRSKILLHTSEYEGQCLVFSEALAHGMYVVSRHVGRIEESEKHLIGWSDEELYVKCLEILHAPMQFTPYRSLNTAEIIEQYLKLYNSSVDDYS